MSKPESLLHIDDLMSFLDASPVNFLAVETMRLKLEAADFVRLEQSAPWHIERGGKYYVVKNGSAIFAFIAGMGDVTDGFKIISAHSDSPGFRIKPNAEIAAPGDVLKLNTEVYGGPILYTWFDRPLSIAGRVILRSHDPLRPEHQLINFNRPIHVSNPNNRAHEPL
ncbi:MAG: M18 family aminopeptidase, partial [Muribaculaceae bacterium]|nr:M18 family aminopeptidase [Muribaculaceae bacterium]